MGKRRGKKGGGEQAQGQQGQQGRRGKRDRQQQQQQQQQQQEEELQHGEEEAAPLQVDPGDVIKVRQLLEETVCSALEERGYEENVRLRNAKLAVMGCAAAVALLGQFWPQPFEESAGVIMACVVLFFLLCGGLQLFSFIWEAEGLLMVTKPRTVSGSDHETYVTKVRTEMPRDQEHFYVILSDDELHQQKRQHQKATTPSRSNAVTAAMYVGRYFTANGFFDEEGFFRDMCELVDLYEQNNAPGTALVFSVDGVDPPPAGLEYGEDISAAAAAMTATMTGKVSNWPLSAWFGRAPALTGEEREKAIAAAHARQVPCKRQVK